MIKQRIGILEPPEAFDIPEQINNWCALEARCIAFRIEVLQERLIQEVDGFDPMYERDEAKQEAGAEWDRIWNRVKALVVEVSGCDNDHDCALFEAADAYARFAQAAILAGAEYHRDQATILHDQLHASTKCLQLLAQSLYGYNDRSWDPKRRELAEWRKRFDRRNRRIKTRRKKQTKHNPGNRTAQYGRGLRGYDTDGI